MKRILLSIAFLLVGTPTFAQTQIGGGGSSVSPNSPIPQSQVGPGFNVKNYGAKGDTQFSATSACSMTSGSPLMTCTGANFTAAANIGMRANCGTGLGGGLFFTAGSTIIGVNSPTVAVISSNSGATTSGSCAWGHLDDAPIATAVAAWLAAIQSGGYQGGIFNNSNNPRSPVLYFPAGAYMTCANVGLSTIYVNSSGAGARIEGDAPLASFMVPCDQPANTGGVGYFIGMSGSFQGLMIRNMAFDGVFMPVPGNPPAVQMSGGHVTENLSVTRFNGGPGFQSQAGGVNENINVNNSSSGIQCNSCGDEFHNGGTSNNGTGASAVNLQIQNTVGSPFGSGPRFTGAFLVDECGASTLGCTQLVNSRDVWFEGVSAFGTPNSFCINIDANSFLHWLGGICGVFNNDTNTSGPKIAPGGVLQASDLRMISSGTGKCATANGAINDNGGISCESMFQIASGTSTGTTAVLTLTTLGANANTNCSAGDTIEVDGSALAGYNGYFPFAITATGASSLTYTTVASNIGALGTGGVAYCKNLQTYTGNLPKALLNNPIPNTCYYTITPVANATTVTLCNFSTGTATNVTRIRASSQVTTTCATAPIITISDGTATQTLTLTSAKNSWDSAVDASTGVGTTIFKPNGTITVKYDVAAASACATPPTNLAISYNISPILSN